MIRKPQQLSDTTPEKLSPLQAVFALCLGLLNSLALRLILAFALASVLAAIAADIIYPQLILHESNSLAQTLATQLQKQPADSAVFEDVIRSSHPAWYYVSDRNGKISSSIRSDTLPAGLTSAHGKSRELTFNGKHYHEVTASLQNGATLHLAFENTYSFSPCLLTGSVPAGLLLPAGYVFVLGYGMLLILLLLMEVWIARPLNRLARAASSFSAIQNAYLHLTGGIDIPGAVTEVQNLKRSLILMRTQYDDLNSARVGKDSELRRIKLKYEEEKRAAAKQYEEQLAQWQHQLSELQAKEVEDEFINSLSVDLDLIRSSKQLCEQVLKAVNNKYPASVLFGGFFKADRSLNCNLLCHLNFDTKSVKYLGDLNQLEITKQLLHTGQYLHVARPSMADYGLEDLAENNGINHCIYMPVMFQQHKLGVFAFFIVPAAINIQELLRVLRNVSNITARALYKVILYEQATEAAHTDSLTNLPNRKFLDEHLPRMVDHAAASSGLNPISIIVIHPEQLRTVVESSGRLAGDQIVKELAKTIRTCIIPGGWIQEEEETHLVRFASDEFIIVLDRFTSERALETAKRVQQTIENRSTWPGGIAALTVSQGISTFPENGTTPLSLIEAAEAALTYGRETLGANHIFHASQLPANYRSATHIAIDGDLAAFDAGGLLQSVANSQQTGVLTVESSTGNQLWTLFENGKPSQARLGKFKGDIALTEFLVTFTDGTFSFQELYAGLPGVKLPKLDGSYNIHMPLDYIVLNGALAKDNYNAAKILIPSIEVLVRKVGDQHFAQRWEQLKNMENPPTLSEYKIMEELARYADGLTTLEKIFEQFESVLTHELWHSCAILIQHKLIEVRLPQVSSALKT